MSDRDLVICTAGGLKSSTSALIPEMDNREALTLPSTPANPPPLPPKRHQRSPASEKTLTQDPQLKALNMDNEPLNSLACHMSPVLGDTTGNNNCLDLVPVEKPGIHNSYVSGYFSKVEPKCHTQFSPRPPLKSTTKPPQPIISKRAETEEREQRSKHEAEWRKLKEKTIDKKNRQELDLTEKNEKMEENEETSQIESHPYMAKPPRQILVLFTDRERGGEEGEDRGKEDEDPNSIRLTTPSVTENTSPLAMDLTPDEEPAIVPTNRNCTSVSARPEPTIVPQLPPKTLRKYSPKPTIRPPEIFSAMRAEIEEEKERRKQEDEQWRDKDLIDKERDEKEEGKDRGELNGDTEPATPATIDMPFQPGEVVMNISEYSVNQELELPRGGQRFGLKPHCRNGQMPVITAEEQILHQESQHPGKKHQNKATGQVQCGAPQEVPTQVNPMGTDPNMETLKWTEEKEIQMSGQAVQDSEVISKLPSGHWEGTEVVGPKLDPCQLGLKRLEDTQDGQLKQTNHKTNARGKVKQLAKKVMGRLKEGREEKRRIKAIEMEMDGVREDDIELTDPIIVFKDERKHREEGGMKDEEKEVGMGEVAVDQSAVTETQSHADQMDRRIKRRNATSESPFSSFKVCSPVKLVEELLSGDEWSQFLYRDQSSEHDPPPCQTHLEDTGQLSLNFQVNCRAELTHEMFGSNPAIPEDSVYEDIDLSDITKKSQTLGQQGTNRVPFTIIPTILLESETNQMSPRTKDIYETVEFFQPVQPANTHAYFSDIKSQGVLNNEVQKYLIKLSKKRKHRAARKQRRNRNHETLGQFPASTSPQQVFPASIFYNIPASGGEGQLSAVKSGGSSPRSLAKIKMALKDKTMLRAAQPKEDRGK